MRQLTKTQKKIDELTTTMNEEFSKTCAEECAVERVAAMHAAEQTIEDHIKAYERHKIWTTAEEAGGGDNSHAALERNNRTVSSVITAMEYVKTHPAATADDIRRLGLPLPDVMDPGTLILIVRCSRIVEKYEAHKPRLMSNVFELVRGTPAEG
jgi:hypothetical protein